MPRYISVLYALPYLAVKSYKVMRRRISIAAAIISAVVLCAAQCAYIMDNNILNSGTAALIEIVLTYLSVNVHITCLSAYKICECRGYSRVDFFIDRRDGRIILNEINTIPGFTPISMYPKVWEKSGLSMSEVIDRHIELALSREDYWTAE